MKICDFLRKNQKMYQKTQVFKNYLKNHNNYSIIFKHTLMYNYNNHDCILTIHSIIISETSVLDCVISIYKLILIKPVETGKQ